MDLVQKLIEFGLSDKEARVYLALLELEVATAHEVARKAELNRSSTYVILESLCKQGLASASLGEVVRKYVATSPEILAERATNALERQRAIEAGIDKILPELRGLYKDTKHRPRVRILEGREGLISAMKETLTTTEKRLRTFTSGEIILSAIPDYMPEWSRARLEQKIAISGIYVDNQATRIINEMSPRLGVSVFVPQKNYPSPVDVMVWDSKVGYLVVEANKLCSIILESEEISIVTKNMFDMAFEQAKLNGSYVKYK